MVFLIDIPTGFSEEIENGSELSLFLTKAHQIYNFLYTLGSNDGDESARFRKLSKIILLNADQNLDCANVLNTLRNYNPDPRVYKQKLSVKDIDLFPTAEKLVDKFIRNKVLHLLNTVEIINTFNPEFHQALCYNKADFLTYLSICSEICLGVLEKLKSSNQQIFIYSDAAEMKSKMFTGIKEIPGNLFFDVQSKLSEARKKYSEYEPDLCEARTVIPPDLFESYDHSLAVNLKEIKEKDYKHIIIQVQDSFLIHQAVIYLLPSEPPLHYDFNKEQIYFSENLCSSIVLLNVDKSKNKAKLFELIKLADKKGKTVILQYNDASWKRDFYGYAEILFPNWGEVKDNFTSIFVSLLLENHKYEGLPYKLYLFAKSNCFLSLLPQTTSISALQHIVNTLSKVSESDLLNNIAFWCNLHSQAEILWNESEMSQSNEVEEVFYETVSFDNIGSDWIVNMPGHIQFFVPYKGEIGLKYIITILKNHEYGTDKEIHIDQLRKIIIQYAKGFNKIKNTSDNMDTEDIRRNVHDAIKSLRVKYSHLDHFCNEHIEYSKEFYSFLPMGKISGKYIKFEITDPNWKNSLLKF